jgi:hypothetical protein
VGKSENLLTTDDTWGTPEYIYEPLVKGLGPIGLDPCAHPDSRVPCGTAILLEGYRPRTAPAATRTIYGDGLVLPWAGYGFTYVNSPYSNLDEWGAKMCEDGDEVVSLAPWRTGNVFWAPTFGTASVECRLLRVTHRGATAHAPFHQGLFYWGDRPKLAAEVFASIGGPESVRLHPRLTRPVWA